MSIRIDDSGDDLRRTANLPDESACTIAGWAYIVTDRGASTYQTLAGIEGVVAGTWNVLYWEGSSEAMRIESGSGGANFASRPATGEWFFFALVTSSGAGNCRGYWSGANSNTFNTQTTTTQASTVDLLTIGNDSGLRWASARFANIKCWNAALSQADLELEKWSYAPKRYANLNFWWPLRNSSETQDWGNNKRNATVTGTLTTENNPPITWSYGRKYFSPASGTLFMQSVGGTLSLAGALLKQTNKTLAGTLTSAGAFSKQTNKVLSGAVATAGTLNKQTSRPLTGTLLSSGELNKQTNKVLSGGLTLAGALTSIRLFVRDVGGTLGLSGTISKQAQKTLGGTITPTASLTKQTQKVLDGTLNPTGNLNKQTARQLAGTLSPQGDNVPVHIPFNPGGAIARGFRRLFSMFSGRR